MKINQPVICEVIAPVLGRYVDGDTYYLYVRGLFREIHYKEFRLNGYDTPEKQSPLANAYEKRRAADASTFAKNWFLLQKYIEVEVEIDTEKYGRWLGTFTSITGSNLGEELEALDLAVPYHGVGKKWRDLLGQAA